MKQRKLFAYTFISALLLFTSSVNAAVDNPKLDINDNGPLDTGIAVTATTFDIDGTAFTIITDGAPIDIPDVDFRLTSTGVGGIFSGSFSVDGGAALSGTFDNLIVSLGPLGGGQFDGDVTYTGGTLAGSIPGGRLEGGWDDSGMFAKLGPIVPVPAAVWLFASGLIGLIGLARRRKA